MAGIDISCTSVQEIKRIVTTREKDGKEQLTSDLAEAVTASQVTEAVQKQRKVDLHEQLLFMDPIQEAGTASSCAQASHLKEKQAHTAGIH